MISKHSHSSTDVPIIPAIPTRFHGYTFRSRLEARWAVFFDAMRWPYRYEPEGFLLSNGTAYLPDFFLPDFALWIEIKGVLPTDTEQLTALHFEVECPQTTLLLAGECYAYAHTALFFPRTAQGGVCPVLWPQTTLAACYACEQGVWLVTAADEAAPLVPCHCVYACDLTPRTSAEMMQAYSRARSAQFETRKELRP